MSQYREFIGQVVRALPNEEEVVGVMQGWISNLSALRKALRLALLPVPVITVTGEENLDLPSWVKWLEEDVAEPAGTMEIEVIELLDPGERRISGEEMRARAKARGANLGLRHAQAFHAKYRYEDFGLPAGTFMTFPGTVAVDGDGRRYVPYLCSNGGECDLNWYCLRNDWRQNDRLVRPRA